MNLSSKRVRHFCAFLLVACVVWGCTPSTRIMGTWKNPEAGSRMYEKIVVAALTDNVRARQTVETDMQTQLQQRGLKAVRSIDMFPPTMTSKNGPDVNQLLRKVREQDLGAILTVALIDEETETRYVPGNYGYSPMTRYVWYGRFRGYYTYWYPTLYDPGYYTEEKTYFVETNLYDADTENLLWSAQSEAYSPASLRKASANLAELTVNQMRQEGLIK
ncbi:DUF4136 domain-containing protein [Pontibacter mangrovi]|uniref:DUF4136 domain-containing protein n=1 Tax=Pontibacter mangrovi TaxID=2589816 RepID=A0A501W5A9_9BACT|nr:DUF4136 domain-containing protein [Pontibacter mangrovi]TPE43845.1 DUF4136 domain-containing protein [Pontibacter mangrovi]